MKYFILLSLALAACQSEPAAPPPPPPPVPAPAAPAPAAPAPNPQLVQAQAAVTGFWAAARRGDTRQAQAFCAPNPDTEGLLEPQNHERLQRWANAVNTSAHHGTSYSEGDTRYLQFGYNWTEGRGNVNLLYNPATGKIERIDQDAE